MIVTKERPDRNVWMVDNTSLKLSAIRVKASTSLSDWRVQRHILEQFNADILFCCQVRQEDHSPNYQHEHVWFLAICIVCISLTAPRTWEEISSKFGHCFISFHFCLIFCDLAVSNCILPIKNTDSTTPTLVM